ncbi:MAG: phosphatase PAP2 family protein [Candidatus Nanohaloarchaea archaeon]
MGLDTALFEAIQSLTGIAAVDQAMVFFAEYLVVLVPAVLVYLWFQGREGKHDSILAFDATVAGIVAAYALGMVYSHQNPSTMYNTIAAAKPENAFPSQHAAAMFSAAWPLFMRDRKNLGYLMLAAAILTGFSRIYIGEHWPVDILGSVAASVAGVAVVYFGEDYVELLDPVYELSERVEERLQSLL